jgi:hypothetical protein
MSQPRVPSISGRVPFVAPAIPNRESRKPQPRAWRTSGRKRGFHPRARRLQQAHGKRASLALVHRCQRRIPCRPTRYPPAACGFSTPPGPGMPSRRPQKIRRERTLPLLGTHLAERRSPRRGTSSSFSGGRGCCGGSAPHRVRSASAGLRISSPLALVEDESFCSSRIRAAGLSLLPAQVAVERRRHAPRS